MSAPDVFFVQSRISQALHRKSRMATEAGEPDIMHFMCKAYQPQRQPWKGGIAGSAASPLGLGYTVASWDPL